MTSPFIAEWSQGGMGLDPVALSQALIRCASVTPADAGAQDRVAEALERIGFLVTRLPFESQDQPRIENLYARIGDSRPNLCFAGHTDVVPPGDRAAWSVDPFAGEIRDGYLWGRGAVDMKSAIGAFIAAVARYIETHGSNFGGSISLLITGDEEGPAINGTRRVLEWLKERGEVIDACVVGEPTNPTALGEMIKIGRRGSLNGTLTVRGIQGHTAYPHLADNPIDRLVKMLAVLAAEPLDKGSEHFQPSTLAFTSIDVGNPATNVIPAEAKARFNIRFNDLHTGPSIEEALRKRLDSVGGSYELMIDVSGEAFLTPPGRLSSLLVDSAERILGQAPRLSTSGGTSDARFIKDYCPVAEFGLVGLTMHKVDERVAVEDIHKLTAIYGNLLEEFFM